MGVPALLRFVGWRFQIESPLVDSLAIQDQLLRRPPPANHNRTRDPAQDRFLPPIIPGVYKNYFFAALPTLISIRAAKPSTKIARGCTMENVSAGLSVLYCPSPMTPLRRSPSTGAEEGCSTREQCMVA